MKGRGFCGRYELSKMMKHNRIHHELDVGEVGDTETPDGGTREDCVNAGLVDCWSCCCCCWYACLVSEEDSSRHCLARK